MVVSFRDRLSVCDGQIAMTRRNRDGWCRFMTVCQFSRVLENMQSGVTVCGENVGGS